MKRAVFLDALGTMLWMRPPWEELDPNLAAAVEPPRLRAAFMAEITYYLEHIEEGSDAEGLAELRRRCARVLSERAGIEIGVEQMLAAIRFEPFEDAAPTLRELRDLDLTLICVSNWDCSLPEVLTRVGLAPLLDGAVSSASSAARKPDPAIFGAALELAGCEPGEALHVGDSDEDIAGAGAAGITALRIDRSAPAGGEARDRIASLSEIRQHPALRW